MARTAPFSTTFLLITAATVLISCGSSHQLKSVSITPAIADAKNFPNGQVQFMAAGTFSNPPSPETLTSNQVTWCYGGLANVTTLTAGMCAGNIAQFASVDQNGLAQCVPLFQGTVYILAGTEPNVMNPDGGAQLKVYGSAQLTCP